MIINGEALLALNPIQDMLDRKESCNGLSFGLSEVGYDFRVRERVEFIPPDPSAIPTLLRKFWHTGSNFELSLDDQIALYGATSVTSADGTVVTNLGRCALASSVEFFHLPETVWAELRNKSTHAREFMDAALGTDMEPGWQGYLTIEIVFNGNRPLVLREGTPILKAVFHPITEPRSYKGKYQNQPAEPIKSIYT